MSSLRASFFLFVNTHSNYDFGFGCMAAAVDDFVVVVVVADNWITD